ncbi:MULTISPECIES: phosphoserine phosphatase SerB [Subtercola]|uniref:phosphoserine phosphatase n=1 Tax=Subtercola vilae TaxID=2056433 RepID=A0A4T2CDN7_9MICO|nr:MULTISPECIES: phosphoserine phosphatase SerB [Subtercola]MEA9983748.1 phosphoserine phosphatase SerB [Subtercola sp. RTI3]TIH40706.1 phosphoserine phosphatase SerB [Subtercola vilae]
MSEHLLLPDARLPLQQTNTLLAPRAVHSGTPAAHAPATAPRFLVVLDVDSTLIENEVIEMLAECAGSLDLVAHITERAMSGELDFQQSLRSRVSTLAGLSIDCFTEVARDIRVTQGVPELIAGLHAADGLVGVVSGGFHELVDQVAIDLGLDFWSANRLEVVDGRLTGNVIGPVIDAEAKAAALREWAAGASIPLAQTVAVGDGANDLLMMQTAGLSVAFNARPVVRARAHVAIDSRDLAQLLPLLGLRG